MIFDLADPLAGSRKTACETGHDKSNILDSLLLENLLEEQQTLKTPVTLFSEAYDQATPFKRFAHLIPLSKPQPGEQYSFEVNLDACTGCKACVVACHSLNGLDDNESWRDMGLLVGTRKQPYLQTVTTACHHCADPACADGCPVLAYDKDAVTGIVRHLDDQCIGCSYCILKCPYDVPKFNLKRGIVRKCDMCHGRLAEGEAPACVQACPNEAIKIVAVRTVDISSHGSIISGAFESSYTRPSTRYVSKRPLPAHAHAADASRLERDHSHAPLSWMLVMTQMSTGAFIACAVALWMDALTLQQAGITSAVAFFVGFMGIQLSVLHLGQPLKAWRAFMGWRKSWLSREILAFGGFIGAASSVMAAWWWGDLHLLKLAVTGTAFIGILAVLTSIMVYVDTRRPYWSFKLTAGKFLGTMLLLGAGLTGIVWCWLDVKIMFVAISSTLVMRWIVSLFELNQNAQALTNESSPWHKSARILDELHSKPLEARRLLLAATGFIIPVMILSGLATPILFTLSVSLTFTSQIIERLYFFTAASGSKMPGN
ncbi:nitrate reductase (quinol-dependent) transmembrane subunit [Prosthecobacter fusiformis]|uniref:Nitrate reductase (Quinol-dependent) transmembrane subunit n=1 Tax=Prosthecobacter fusiformis TaxID=48464 RepID=A0A4R7S4R3_9BACT|nr:DmsC/YnfH family molybdoenzyme membrane anchor subunit [Prosthecobacter fusiformis]TDU73432.1 nitrate reductase (quinol-dependent) transmembrane subunit [Prosthecobacter fusiformis]